MRAVGLALLVACSGSPEPTLPAGDPARPDVLLISIDTLRADHVGAWGYERPTTPFLDTLAGQGTRFASAWSPAPWTLPAHTTMLSGLLPPHHGSIEEQLPIRPEVPLVQEAFSGAGYATGGAVATLYVSSRFGFQRGFDWFDDFGIRSEKVNLAGTVDAENVFGAGRAWAASQAPGRPVFLFLHVYDVHYGYDAPSPWNEKFDRVPEAADLRYRSYRFFRSHDVEPDQRAHQIAQYDEEIAYVDDALRKLVEGWRASGRELVVAVTADHGEEFWERGSWGHAHTLYPEQLHVPWIVQGPGVRTQVAEQRVGLEDLAPTLAGLARVPFPSGDGRDLSDLLRTGVAASGAVHLPAAFADTSRFETLRLRWHRVPWELYADLRGGTRTLCHTGLDPDCRTDRHAVSPEVALALEAEWTAWIGAPWEAVESGVVTTDGAIVADGAVTRRLDVKAGQRFAVLPGDAEVRWAAGEQALGPYRALGGPAPEPGAPLRYQGLATGVTVELSDAERAALEALGYAQPEPGSKVEARDDTDGSEAP